MKILVLSFYYPPDLSAGAFRMVSIVDELARQTPAGAEISVLTTTPNRYRSYRREAPTRETVGKVRIERVDVGEHASGMRDQSRAFLRYLRGVRRATRKRSFDLVLATSSRLFTAFLAALVRRTTGGTLYLDFRDIFRESIGDVLGQIWYAPLRGALWGVERFTVGSADRLCLVSEGFVDYFEPLVGRENLVVFTNGIDPEFIKHSFTGGPAPNPRPRVLYAGNIGEGQGLHRLFPEAARLLPDFDFRLIGDGGRRPNLEAAIRDGVPNVELLAPMGREDLIEQYAAADYLLLHLNRYRAFERVLPSKLFEYAATGKPILAGVSGYARRFVEQEISNAAMFKPCDAAGLAAALPKLTMAPTERVDFVKRFDRSAIARRYVDDILARTRVSFRPAGAG